MPEISRFYGIVIMMFYNEHNPPHFHVNYGEFRIIINLKDDLVNGFMPKRALKLVFEWMELHEDELMKNWNKCQAGIKPDKIEPLK